MKDELEKAKEIKEDEEKQHKAQANTLAAIAQDLRTPLSIISSSLKSATDLEGLEPEAQQKYKLAYRNTLYIQEACEQFIRIQNHDLFENKLKVSACPVYKITDAVIRSAREIISVSPIHIDYGEEKEQTILWIDFSRLETAVQIMLSSAFRRTHYAGNIQCSIEKEVIDAKEYCIFRIVDDAKNPSAIVSQAETVGLSLLDEIAKRHHGFFKFEEYADEGTESKLYIPIGKEHFADEENIVFMEASMQTENKEEAPLVTTGIQETVKEENVETKDSKNKQKILIVEPHKDTRMFLKLQFSSEYMVYLAKNGQEGVDMARKNLPDLIISEVKLPVMNGFELTRTLKDDADTCHTPIILVTTLTNNEDIIKGMELGADDYIRKPFDIEVLKSKVRQLIKNRTELKKAYTKLLIPAPTSEDSPTTEKNGEQPEDPLVTKVLQLINDNIQNEDFSVKKLAEMLNMSQPTLYRKIKQSTNFTLIEVVRGVRLKRAAELLKSKKYNVQEAAEAVGYNDIPTFRKHFIDLYGITPSAFSKEDSTEKK